MYSVRDWAEAHRLVHVEGLGKAAIAVRLGIPEQDAESWLLNKLVHNNDWANGTEADFRPVLSAAQDFLSLFRCDNTDSESWIAVSGNREPRNHCVCACQTYNLNLQKK